MGEKLFFHYQMCFYSIQLNESFIGAMAVHYKQYIVQIPATSICSRTKIHRIKRKRAINLLNITENENIYVFPKCYRCVQCG